MEETRCRSDYEAIGLLDGRLEDGKFSEVGEELE